MAHQNEGDDIQRRKRAKEARDRGNAPSEEGVTKGGSQQNRSLTNQADHEDRITSPGHGKQQPDRVTSGPKPGSIDRTPDMTANTDRLPPRSGAEHAPPGELSDADAHVLQALAELETEDRAPTASDLARSLDQPVEPTQRTLQRLIGDHDVVRELPGDADLGPRYRVKA